MRKIQLLIFLVLVVGCTSNASQDLEVELHVSEPNEKNSKLLTKGKLFLCDSLEAAARRRPGSWQQRSLENLSRGFSEDAA